MSSTLEQPQHIDLGSSSDTSFTLSVRVQGEDGKPRTRSLTWTSNANAATAEAVREALARQWSI